MSDGLFAQGTGMYVGISGSWVEVPELRRVTPPEAQSTFNDTTHFKSPNNDDEFRKGLNRKGNCTFSMAFQPSHEVTEFLYDMRDEIGDDAKFPVCIEYPDAAQTMRCFDAFVESISEPAEVGQDIILQVSLKPTGKLFRKAGGHATVAIPLVD